MEYSAADEPKKIAAELIPKYHDHLSGVRIEFVFMSETPKHRDKIDLARIKKKSGLDAFLCAPLDKDPEPFFVMEIAKPGWDELSKAQKRALIDHELCHCFWDVDHGIALLDHDVEEFAAVIERHGLWREDVEHFAQVAMRQLSLPLSDPPKDNGKAKAQRAARAKEL
jgi:hypothetical protein